MNRRRISELLWTSLAVLFFGAVPARALGPHECALLVNRNSRDSVELANYYAYLRQIPPLNIVWLDLPEKAMEADASFTPEEFREHIYEPVQKVLRDRNIAGHVLAWLYSADFPPLIEATPPMSLTGMTYVRGNPPEAGEVSSGKWLSPMFAGPETPDGSLSPTVSMEEFTLRLGTNMPLPSMMIAWTGSRGMTVEQAKDHLKVSASADGSHPSASVFFEQTDDVRSKTRSWQFDRVVKELAPLGVAAFTVSNAPRDRLDVMGIMAGRPSFNKHQYGRLQPGAYADHLTSFAAVFHDANQRKLTEWLRRGAAGSSGTVTEPGSLSEPVVLWAKFPHARLFAHYARGCSLIESIFLSIRCPLQILLVGDALCNPWAKPPGITLVSMADDEDEPIRGMGEYLASSWGGFGQRSPTTIFFLDGRPVSQSGNNNMFNVDTKRLYDGSHYLRVVAYGPGSIRHQGFDEVIMRTRNRGRETLLSGYDPGQEVDLYHHLKFQVSAAGSPIEVAVIAQERIVGRAAYSNNVTVAVAPFAVGAGPVTFQAVAVYDDNRPVRSEPITLRVVPLNKPPVIQTAVVSTNKDESLTLTLTARDEDGDNPALFWYADVLEDDRLPTYHGDNAEHDNPGDGVLSLASAEESVHATFDIANPAALRELRATLSFPEGNDVSYKHRAGVLFNYRDPENYLFWGIDGNAHAWVLERVEAGVKKRIFSRGDLILPRKPYGVMILAIENGRMGFFVDDNLMGVAPASFAAGEIGFTGSEAVSTFNHLLINPPSAYRRHFEEQVDDLVVEPGHDAEIRYLYGAARDGQFTTLEEIQ